MSFNIVNRLPAIGATLKSHTIWRVTGPRDRSKTKLAVRAEPDKLKAFIVRLAVNQDEVWPDVAIAVIAPLATQRVIEIAARQRLIVCQRVDGFEQ